jgi:hypothetical protein
MIDVPGKYGGRILGIVDGMVDEGLIPSLCYSGGDVTLVVRFDGEGRGNVAVQWIPFVSGKLKVVATIEITEDGHCLFQDLKGNQ